MQNPFVLTKERKMKDKVGKTAAAMGFAPVTGPIKPPHEHFLNEFGEMLERLMNTAEYKKIKRRRLNDEITAAEAWELTGKLAQKLQQK